MFLRVLLNIFGSDEDWKVVSPYDRAASYRISAWGPILCRYMNRIINLARNDQLNILYTHKNFTLLSVSV